MNEKLKNLLLDILEVLQRINFYNDYSEIINVRILDLIKEIETYERVSE